MRISDWSSDVCSSDLICHAVTVAKTGREDEDPAKSAEERAQLGGWAEQMSFPTLHRLWQLLLKGHDEVANAAMPIEACEMALLRVVPAAGLPDPGELARMLRERSEEQTSELQSLMSNSSAVFCLKKYIRIK